MADFLSNFHQLNGHLNDFNGQKRKSLFNYSFSLPLTVVKVTCSVFSLFPKLEKSPKNNHLGVFITIPLIVIIIAVDIFCLIIILFSALFCTNNSFKCFFAYQHAPVSLYIKMTDFKTFFNIFL